MGKWTRRQFLYASLLGSGMVAASPLIRSFARAAEAPKFLTFGGGGMGGAWYLGAATMAELAKGIWPGVSATAVPGGGKSNPRKLGRKELDVAYMFALDEFDAYNGIRHFKGRAVKDLRAVMTTNPAYSTTLARPPIASFRELKGRSAGPGRAGFTGLVTFRLLMKEYGLEGQFKEVNSGYSEMASLYKDGIVDGVSVIGSIPHLVPNEILTTHKGTILEVDEDVAKRMAERYGYEIMTIPANTFKGQTKPVRTVGSVTTVATRADVPEEWVYRITKATWENRDRMVRAHIVYKDLTKDMVIKGIRIPFHPGAERYWREIGVLK